MSTEAADRADAPRRTGVGARLRAYVALTKPRIIELLLVTTVPPMVVAAGGLPPLGTVAATLAGGVLAAGGAQTLNSYLERDVDRLMRRTAHRPLPRGEVSPRGALVFGLVLGAASFVLLAAAVNLLAAVLALAGLVVYVVVYTMLLKPRTPQNIVIGGAAGCFPPLVGWAAVTGEVGLPALLMFAVVFLWTPPHFWALAIRHRDDYARAGVPMLPVTGGVRRTAWQMTAYAAATTVASAAIGPTAGLSAAYTSVAVVLGVAFTAHCAALLVGGDAARDRATGVFRHSIAYLGVVFVMMAVDAALLA